MEPSSFFYPSPSPGFLPTAPGRSLPRSPRSSGLDHQSLTSRPRPLSPRHPLLSMFPYPPGSTAGAWAFCLLSGRGLRSRPLFDLSLLWCNLGEAAEGNAPTLLTALELAALLPPRQQFLGPSRVALSFAVVPFPRSQVSCLLCSDHQITRVALPDPDPDPDPVHLLVSGSPVKFPSPRSLLRSHLQSGLPIQWSD